MDRADPSLQYVLVHLNHIPNLTPAPNCVPGLCHRLNNIFPSSSAPSSATVRIQRGWARMKEGKLNEVGLWWKRYERVYAHHWVGVVSAYTSLRSILTKHLIRSPSFLHSSPLPSTSKIEIRSPAHLLSAPGVVLLHPHNLPPSPAHASFIPTLLAVPPSTPKMICSSCLILLHLEVQEMDLVGVDVFRAYFNYGNYAEGEIGYASIISSRYVVRFLVERVWSDKWFDFNSTWLCVCT